MIIDDNLIIKVAVLQERLATLSDNMITGSIRAHDAERLAEKRVIDVLKRLEDIEDHLTMNKAFIGGMIFTITGLFAAISWMLHTFKVI